MNDVTYVSTPCSTPVTEYELHLEWTPYVMKILIFALPDCLVREGKKKKKLANG